jgi:hypothetical protein
MHNKFTIEEDFTLSGKELMVIYTIMFGVAIAAMLLGLH